MEWYDWCVLGLWGVTIICVIVGCVMIWRV